MVDLGDLAYMKEPLYRNGQHYDLLHGDWTQDIALYLELAQKQSGPVLDLACGTGRITLPLAECGIEIVGLDKSPSMLAHAKQKAADKFLQVSFVESDCRKFSLNKEFTLVTMAANSFCHLHDLVSIEACLANISAHLSEQGVFAFEIFNPPLKRLSSDQNRRLPISQYPDPHGDGIVVLEEIFYYDELLQCKKSKWYYSINDHADIKVEEMSLRCFFPQEIDAILHYNGFKVLEKLGNYDKKPFAPGDKKQVIICGKKTF